MTLIKKHGILADNGLASGNHLPPELERQVNIAILQQQAAAIEKRRKRFFSWQAFAFVALLGALAGCLVYFWGHQSDNEFERRDKIVTYFSNSHYPRSIVARYNNENQLLPSNYKFDSKHLYSDTTGFYLYANQYDSAKTAIEKDLAAIEKGIKTEDMLSFARSAALGVVTSCLVYFLFISIAAFYWKSQVNRIKLKLVDAGAKELKQNLDNEGEKDFFTQLVQINFKYLDQYYLQTQMQADKSFWISAVAAMIGFLLIISGIIVMLNKENHDPGYVATASGVLSEFIASVFFYLYNRTILKMSQYHQKLVITQNISLALKSADHLKDTKEKVLETIIDRLTTDINKYLTNHGE